jgi:hypothetical protein
MITDPAGNLYRPGQGTKIRSAGGAFTGLANAVPYGSPFAFQRSRRRPRQGDRGRYYWGVDDVVMWSGAETFPAASVAVMSATWSPEPTFGMENQSAGSSNCACS